MFSNAPVNKAMVLVNRRMKVERGVTTFGPVCSKVAGIGSASSRRKAYCARGSESLSVRWAQLPERYLIIAHQPCYGLRGYDAPYCTTRVRIAPAFAPGQEERALRSRHHSPHIAVRGRDRPGESPRST